MESCSMVVQVINVIAIIVMPLLTLMVSDRVQKNNARRSEKLWILKTLMSHRRLSRSIEYVNALNLIDVIFFKSSKVLEAYKELYKQYNSMLDLNNEKNCALFSESVNRAETKLVEAIIDDVGYKDEITWDRIQQPYVPRWLFDESESRSEYVNAQKAFSTIVNETFKRNNSDNKG